MALFLNESEVRGLLTMTECIDAVETAFVHSSSGLAENVPRKRIRLPRGFLHLMSAAAVASDMTGLGYKAYTTFPRGESKFLMMLYDGEQWRVAFCYGSREIWDRYELAQPPGWPPCTWLH